MDEKDSREVIVQYIGTAQEVLKDRVASYQELLGGFAIIQADSSQIRELESDYRVLYMEYPRDVFYEGGHPVNRKQTAGNCYTSEECQTEGDSGLSAFQISGTENICRETDGSLTGKGILMAYLDSGIDYRHPEFLDKKGESRILEIYDLSTDPGTVYTRQQINEALRLNRQEGNRIVPETDGSGHGTHVAGIGSGNSGVAPGSDILMVKLGRGARQLSRTSELMLGMDHCIRLAALRNQPAVLNISYGNNFGAHNGTAMVEQYLDTVLNYAKATIVVGSGNEGGKSGHFSGMVSAGEPLSVQLSIGQFQPGFGFGLYKDFKPDMSLTMIAPGGERVVLETERRQAINEIAGRPVTDTINGQQMIYAIAGQQLRVYNPTPSPRAVFEEVYMELVPENTYLPQGLWQLLITGTDAQPWQVDLWLPVSESLAPLTGFLTPSPDTTLTIPSSARRAVTVGAYDSRYGQVASFSGQGYTWNDQLVKPDLVAPGVGILSASAGGGYTRRSGTSMATPFVSGAAALLMQWGILQGHDPFLYADKVKAYLIRGARPLTEYNAYPNERAGWGALCIRDSFPK